MKSPALILLRGAPGSGKTTVAEQIIGMKPNWAHFEIDMYFKSFGEPYVFRPVDAPAADTWCRNATLGALSTGKVVVVSNNFIEPMEMGPYIEMVATGMADRLIVVNCLGEFPSVHGEPERRIERMRERIQQFDLTEYLSRLNVNADVMSTDALLGLVGLFDTQET